MNTPTGRIYFILMQEKENKFNEKYIEDLNELTWKVEFE